MVSNKVFALLSFFVATSISCISWSTLISAVIQNEPSSVSATTVMVLLSASISSILVFTLSACASDIAYMSRDLPSSEPYSFVASCAICSLFLARNSPSMSTKTFFSFVICFTFLSAEFSFRRNYADKYDMDIMRLKAFICFYIMLPAFLEQHSPDLSNNATFPKSSISVILNLVAL